MGLCVWQNVCKEVRGGERWEGKKKGGRGAGTDRRKELSREKVEKGVGWGGEGGEG